VLATLLLAQGTPIILGVDEFARTQQGNNNGYCQDNEFSWGDWSHDERGQALTRFVNRLTGLRRQYVPAPEPFPDCTMERGAGISGSRLGMRRQARK
jgi:pullulanase/glycogen debranching enzyme